jgi:integrase
MRSRLGSRITAYLTLKQALGRRFTTETATLVHLDRFLVEQRRSTLTASSFAAWSLTLSHLTPTVRRNRMRIVRNFCLYLRRTHRGCFVPDPSAFPSHHQPRRPHIFTEEQIAELLRIATRLPSASTSLLRAAVFRIAIVLLYTVGLRRSELARLVLSDYDSREKTLLVRRSKFHKSRLVALSTSAVDEMERYLRARRRLPHSTDAPLLVSNHGGLGAYTPEGLADGIRGLFRIADVRTSEGRFPRVHDIRHTYAIHTLLRWYRTGVDVQAKLPALATAMGHVSVASTAYYLALLEPVAEAASERFARHCRRIFGASGARR